METIKKLLLMASVLCFVACTTQRSHEGAVVTQKERIIFESESEPETRGYSIEVSPEESHGTTYESSSSSAVSSLVEQAQVEYQLADFTRAIALAERALRINRRSPEAYLVLAQSYWQQSLSEQARQFAKKGLRYSEQDSEVYTALQAFFIYD